jgi:hypothetical protein
MSFMPGHGDTFVTAVVAVAAGATGAIIAAPGAGRDIWFRLYGRAGTAISGAMALSDEGTLEVMGWIPLGANLGLSLTTVGCKFDGIVVYCVKNF